MPYDGAGATTHPVVSPTRSLFQTNWTPYAAGATVTIATGLVPVPNASRVRLDLYWQINNTFGALASKAEMAQLNFFVHVEEVLQSGLTGVVLDNFVVYGSDMLETPATPAPATVPTQTRLAHYNVAYPYLSVTAWSYPSTVTPTLAGVLVLALTELGF